jgi:hypothetical protein
LRLDGYYYSIDPLTYIIDYRDTDLEDQTLCLIAVKKQDFDSTSWIIGAPFFRNFYVIYDDERGKMGISPSILSSPVSSIVKGNKMPYEMISGKVVPLSWEEYVIIIALAISVIGLIVILILTSMGIISCKCCS